MNDMRGPRCCSLLSLCATNWRVAGSIPYSVFKSLILVAALVTLVSSERLKEISTRDVYWG